MTRIYYLLCQHCGNLESVYNPNQLTVCSYCNSKQIVLLTSDHYEAREQEISKKNPGISYDQRKKLVRKVLQEELVLYRQTYDEAEGHCTELRKQNSKYFGKRIVCPRCNSMNYSGGHYHTSKEILGRTYVTYKYHCNNCNYDWITRY